MILTTGKDTGRTAYIFVNEIVKTEKMKSGRESFTRVFLHDRKQNHEYFLDVAESPEEIRRRTKEERHILGKKDKGAEEE